MSIKRLHPVIIFLALFCTFNLQLSNNPLEKAQKNKQPDKLSLRQKRIPVNIKRIKQAKKAMRMKENMSNPAGAPSNIDLLGIWPYGSCDASDLDTSRNIAVISNGKAMQVLDISDPSSLSVQGETILDEEATDLEISGDYVYVTTASGETVSNLYAVDISTPASPTVAGSVSISQYCSSLAVTSSYAYTGGGYWGGMDIIDISDPTNPTILDHYSTGYNNMVLKLATWGNFAFVLIVSVGGPSPGEKELQIIDITTPASPSLIGTIQEDENYNFASFAVSETGYVYITQNNKLSVFDVITDPANPSELGNYTESGVSFSEIIVSGYYAYIMSSECELKVLNVTNFSSIYQEGECSTDCYPQDLDFSGGYVLDGCLLYDVSDPSNPFQAGSYATPSGSMARFGIPIVISGDYAFIAEYHLLRILDISDPANISEVGVCDTVKANAGIAISGNYVFGADYTGGFWVVDVSLPTSPTEVVTIPISWDPCGVAVKGDYAYVAGYQYVASERYARLSVYNISDPANPDLSGSYICSEITRCYGIFDIKSDLLYLAVDSGFRIINISDPTNPNEIGSYTGG